MPISMSPSAHYVTQQNVWGRYILGPLTSRRISRYQRLGYYGPSAIVERVAQRAANQKLKRLSRAKVFAKF
jgi:hypothetical protein